MVEHRGIEVAKCQLTQISGMTAVPRVEVCGHGAWVDRAELQVCGHLAGSAEIGPVAVLRIVLEVVLDELSPLVQRRALTGSAGLYTWVGCLYRLG